jgi:hypothetical protein
MFSEVYSGSGRNLQTYKKAIVVGSGSVIICIDRIWILLFGGFQDKIKKQKFSLVLIIDNGTVPVLRIGLRIRILLGSQVCRPTLQIRII